MHAGNLAYLSLASLFPIFLVIASVAGALGRTEAGFAALYAFLSQVPPQVATVLRDPIIALLDRGAKGGLLTLGILFGLWSVSGFVDTIRHVILTAYGVRGAPMWKHRIMSTAGVVLTAVILIFAFAAQFILVGAEQFVARAAPVFSDTLDFLRTTRIVPSLMIFAALYVLFTVLTPKGPLTRTREWPGALLTTVVWVGATTLLPTALAQFADYEATYGSLAGVMISLLFFYVVGLGLVAGAHLNAVLAGAHPDENRQGNFA